MVAQELMKKKGRSPIDFQAGSQAQRDPGLDLLPRTLQRTTALGGVAGTVPAIVYPAGDPYYLELAENLGRAIEARCGVLPEIVADAAIMPARSTPLPAAYRRRSLI